MGNLSFSATSLSLQKLEFIREPHQGFIAAQERGFQGRALPVSMAREFCGVIET